MIVCTSKLLQIKSQTRDVNSRRDDNNGLELIQRYDTHSFPSFLSSLHKLVCKQSSSSEFMQCRHTWSCDACTSIILVHGDF